MDLKSYIAEKSQTVNKAIEKYLSFDKGPFEVLGDAMAYSLKAGGKRVRPVLVLAAAEIFGESEAKAMPFACALELIHTYTLIHDDLPSMDNDSLRRGRPTNHTVFGEGQALLAGNALLALAYEICLQEAVKGFVEQDRAIHALYLISEAIGALGVMGGQSLDILWEGKELDLQQVETVCHHKTATLIAVSVQVGAVISGAPKQKVDALKDYGEAIGLAFQVADDLLNVTGDSEKLGKSTGTDEAKGKTTYPLLLGVDGAREKAEKLLTRSLNALDVFGEEAWMLRELAHYIVYRDR